MKHLLLAPAAAFLFCACTTVSSPKEIDSRSPDRFLGTWEYRRTEAIWMESEPKELTSRLSVKEIEGRPDSVFVKYTAEGLGTCSIEGIAKLTNNKIRFNSWEPADNKELNPLILQDKAPCTLDIVSIKDHAMRVENVSKGCREACGEHGSLEGELTRTR